MQPPTQVLDAPRIKILFIGDSKTGKSCLIKRYCEGRFVNKYIPTIGIDYGVKKIEITASKFKEYVKDNNNNNNNTMPSQVRVNFWDVAGGKESFEIRNEFYTASQGVCIVFDLSDRQSFINLDSWWEEITEYLPVINNNNNNNNGKRASATAQTAAGKAVDQSHKNIPPVLILIGNKKELANNNKVSEEEARAWAAAHHCIGYYEVSASESVNVNESFEFLFYNVINRFFL